MLCFFPHHHPPLSYTRLLILQQEDEALNRFSPRSNSFECTRPLEFQCQIAGKVSGFPKSGARCPKSDNVIRGTRRGKEGGGEVEIKEVRTEFDGWRKGGG